jgi:hypothetical protein
MAGIILLILATVYAVLILFAGGQELIYKIFLNADFPIPTDVFIPMLSVGTIVLLYYEGFRTITDYRSDN